MKTLLRFLVNLAFLAMLVSCGKAVPTLPQTSAGMLIFTEDKLPLEGDEYIYRQGISAGPAAPEAALFAWRIETLSGELPAGFCADSAGWLWFEAPGSNPEIPLSEAGPHRSIWTSQSSLSFDFASSEGKIADLVRSAELQIKSMDGQIKSHRSSFKSDRLLGSLINVGFANGANTGTGIEFGLRERIGDIYLDGLYADHFMFRVNILNYNLQLVSQGEWHSSLEMADLRRVRLNSSTNPALAVNALGQVTQFECYLVSRQGIEEATLQSVHFRVRGNFRPKAQIYSQTLAALGQYHYSINPYEDLYYRDLIPASGTHKNSPFWQNDTDWEAINSPDLKLYLHWGYFGQYGTPEPSYPYPGWSGDFFPSSNPFDREYNICLDAVTHENYHSQISHFDLRLNGAPFPALPQFIQPQQVTHHDKTWLRVPNLNPQASTCILTGLASGEHVLEVCAVDLQGSRSDPASMKIKLIPFKPWESRSGLLIVDDTRHHASVAPESYVDGFYDSVLPSVWGPLGHADAQDDTGFGIAVSPALMQNYRAVIWHSDNPTSPINLVENVDPLDIYLGNDGKVLFSAGGNLDTALDNLMLKVPGFLNDRLGISGGSDFGVLSRSWSTNPFFIRSEAKFALGNMDLMLENAFNPLVRTLQGLSLVTWFDNRPSGTFTHRFGCKPINSPVHPPSQAQYDFYSSKYVGYQHQNVFVFGIPLSYMEPEDAGPALEAILNGLLSINRSTGGHK